MKFTELILLCTVFKITLSACDWFRGIENAYLSLDQNICVNRTVIAGKYYICLEECARQEGCKSVLFPVKQFTGATWCCLVESQEVYVSNGNGYLVFEHSVTVHQCEDNIVESCAGKTVYTNCLYNINYP